MSLIDYGPDAIRVYPLVDVDDGYGGTQPGDGEPVDLTARVQPASSDADGTDGYEAWEDYRVFARSLPAGPWSRVEFRGESWRVVASPQRHGGSRRTSYDVAVIRRRDGGS